MYTATELSTLAQTYRKGLFEDVLPFWIRHSVDREKGGFLFGLDREGNMIHSDKPVWIIGRFSWLLAHLYQEVEPNPEWLELARHGIDFLEAHCFDTDGRMFYAVTREGKPLRKRRYIFSETFAIAAFAKYGQVAGKPEYVQKARDLFKLVLRYLATPGLLEPKVNPETRPSKGLVIPMILIVTAQILREADPTGPYTDQIDAWINEIERDFMKPEFGAVLEMVAPDGSLIDTFEGRTLNPGHAIEAAWFILHEARMRGGNKRLEKIGLQIVDWCWQWGWDETYGGMFYFRDCKNHPPTEYWHDMKFWWPHNETIIATLLAYVTTGDEKYARWHRKVHDWTYAHFPDAEYGEWFGYLHRDGSVSTTLKGNMWKGPFHLPRMQWYCWQLLGD